MAKTTRATKAPGVVVSYDPDTRLWRLTYRRELYGASTTQHHAIVVGSRLARAMRCDLTVIGRNGKIRQKIISHGNETKAKGYAEESSR